MPNSIWKSYSVKADDPPLHLNLGTVDIWIKSKNDEYWIAYEHGGLSEKSEKEVNDFEWTRWAHKSPGDNIKITPVFQDHPVIVSSEFPLKIAPGTTIQIYTGIPVWIRISLEKSDYILTEIPSIKLSRTWFGTPEEGELCYWSMTRARRSLSEMEEKPYVINCPIKISNKASEDLDFEKFCFRVERLGIYLAKENLWADETTIDFRGEELNSDITMTGKLPSNLGKAKQLSKPRNPLGKSFATQTFKMLFDDTFFSAR